MFAAYLWKEWREYRWLILSQGVLVVAIIAAGWCWFHPYEYWVSEVPLGMLCPPFAALMLAIMVFVPDLVPKENRSKGMDLIRRLPGGTGNAFLAKATILSLAILIYGLAGFSSFAFTGLVFDTEHAANDVSAPEMLAAFGALFVLLFAVGFWGLAISCWLRRGTVVIPATLLVLLTWWMPYLQQWQPSWLGFGIKSYNSYRDLRAYPTDPELILLLVFLSLTAFAAAWLSFKGLKLGDRIFRPLLLGLPVLLLSISAVYGWESSREENWCVTAGERDFNLNGALIGKDGRYAYAATSGRTKSCGAIIDLKTGYCRLIPDASFRGIREEAPRHYALCPLELYRTGFSNCRSDYVAQVRYADKQKSIQLRETGTGQLVTDLDRIELPEFPYQEIDRLKTINQHCYAWNTWREMRKERQELSKVSESRYLYDDLWLVLHHRESYRPDSVGFEKRWLLYDAKVRSFASCFLTDTGRCQVSERFHSDFHAVTNTLESNPVTQILPGREAWIVQKQIDGMDELVKWYPAQNRFDEIPLATGFSLVSLYGTDFCDWIITHRTGEKGPANSLLIHRETFETCPVPEKWIRSMTQTPGGKLVMIVSTPDTKEKSCILFDPTTGQIECELRHSYVNQYECFPKNGAYDDHHVYFFTRNYVGPPYVARNLVQVDFKARTARELNFFGSGD